MMMGLKKTKTITIAFTSTYNSKLQLSGIDIPSRGTELQTCQQTVGSHVKIKCDVNTNTILQIL